ncbi:MAG: hypothetical protein AAFV71_15190, partial [Cyanobacteria bacterium J06633_8]
KPRHRTRLKLPPIYPQNLAKHIQICPTWLFFTPQLHLRKSLKRGFYDIKKPPEALAARGFILYARNQT